MTKRTPAAKAAARLRDGSLAILPALALLSACGGGSGGSVVSTPGPSPAPSPTPSPTPAPSPSPTPAASFLTSEYQRSTGPAQHDAITAWRNGATGSGVAIAVIDTGIDSDSPEFAGRLSPSSADVAGSRGIDSPDGHGTQVALVAAAGRNNTGVMGIAYDATVIAIRADTPGSCAAFDPDSSDSGCSFDDADIARGVDLAVTSGARVINISLGGSLPTNELRNALADAAAAGVVIVVSAGNDGASTDPAIDPGNPDPLAIGAVQAGGGNVIVAGSVDENSEISVFSNRAGAYSGSFLAARGEGVCCLYEDGSIYTETENGRTYQYTLSGTSFAAPQIAGAAALLAQAFPNLTGREIVELLIGSADDSGAAGADAIYGSGVLNIGAAFAPKGTTSLAGSGAAFAVGGVTATTSPAMGDGGAQGVLGAIVLDGYDRAYTLDLARNIRTAAQRRPLQRALAANTRSHAMAAKGMTLAFTVRSPEIGGSDRLEQLRLGESDAAGSRVLAAQVKARIAPDTDMAFGFRQGADGMEAALRGSDGPAFLVAATASSDAGFGASREAAVALRRSIGGWGIAVAGESGRVWTSHYEGDPALPDRKDDRYARFGTAVDVARGPFEARLGASWLAEDGTVLGARFHGAIGGGGGADSQFVDAALGWRPAPGWRIGGEWREGLTRPDRGGAIGSGSQLRSRGWSIDAAREGVTGHGDTLALRVSQPLRVSGGALALDLPVGYDYASETAQYGTRRLSLTPSGREIAGEIAWRGPLWGGALAASLFYRRDPGHIASLPDDKGVALRWNASF